MIRHRIGFLSNIDDDAVAAMHRSLAIFTRTEEPPERYGRARVFSVAREAGTVSLDKCGVLLVYGSDDVQMARAMLSKPAKRIVTVTATKPRKDSRVMWTAARLAKRGVEVDHLTIKKNGAAYLRDYAPGGETHEPASLDAPLRPSTAPSVPRPDAEKRDHSEPRLRSHTAPTAPRPTPPPPAPHSAPSTPRAPVEDSPALTEDNAPDAPTEDSAPATPATPDADAGAENNADVSAENNAPE